jgi:hypothetical protein
VTDYTLRQRQRTVTASAVCSIETIEQRYSVGVVVATVAPRYSTAAGLGVDKNLRCIAGCPVCH